MDRGIGNSLARYSALLLWFLAAASGLSQSNTKVSYKTDGSLLRNILQDLSKQMGGKPVYAAEPLASEPVMVRVKDVEYAELIKRIAESVHGEAVELPNQIDIRPKKELLTEKEGLKLRTQQVLDLQQLAREKVAAMPQFDEAAAKNQKDEIEQYIKLLRENPGASSPNITKAGENSHVVRLSYELFASLPADVIAKLPRNQRIVFSNQPTAKQLLLPKAAMEVVSRYSQSQRLWQQTLGNQTIEYPEGARINQNIYHLLRKNFTSDPQSALDDQEPKLIWVACRSLSPSLTVYDIYLVNSAGGFVRTLMFNPGDLLVEKRNAQQLKDDGAKKQVADGLPKGLVNISEDYVTIIGVIQAGWNNPLEATQSIENPSLLSKLLQPEQYDPISLWYGSMATALAELHDIQFVGTVRDGTAQWALTGLETKQVDLSRLLRTSRGAASGIDYTFDQKWLVVKIGKPQDAGFAGKAPGYYRCNRVALGTFVRRMKREGRASLDATAELALSVPPGEDRFDALIQAYISLIIGTRKPLPDLNQLRFYASLDNMQRRVLQDGGTLEFARLRPEQKKLVEGAVYANRLLGMRFTPKDMSGAIQSYQYFHNGVQSEPTYRFAQGITASAPLSMKDRVRTQVTSNRIGKTGTELLISDLSTLGRHIFSNEIGDYQFTFSHSSEPYTSFTVSENRDVTFTINLDSEVTYQFVLEEDLKTLAKADDIKKLPKELREQVERGYNDAKKAYEEFKKGSSPPVVGTRV